MFSTKSGNPNIIKFGYTDSFLRQRYFNKKMANEKLILNFDQHIVSLSEPGYQRNPLHKYIVFTDKPIEGYYAAATLLILEHFLPKIRQTARQWKNEKGTRQIYWTQPKTQKRFQSLPINYSIIAKHLREEGEFRAADFNLPDISCLWLDASVDVSSNYHFTDNVSPGAVTMKEGTLKKIYGEHFPIKPALDREGHLFTTFQNQLLKRIIKKRNELIANSNDSLKIDWIFEFKGLIHDTVSLVDITLNQFYIKAEYHPLPGWKFDEALLGDRKNSRFSDKWNWIKKITGKELNAEKEYQKLFELKNLRNHFNHFDPPCIVITLEEVTEWLNNILHVGLLLSKIRHTISAESSTNLINLLVQKEAKFIPEPAFTKRATFDSTKTGYKSSTWL